MIEDAHNSAIELEEVNLPHNLETEVFEKIEGALEKENRHKKVFGFSFSAIFIILCIPVIMYVASEFARSGFYTYFSLLFTDTNVTLSNINEFGSSIVDAIPFLSVTIASSVLFFLLLSVRYAVNRKAKFVYKINQ